MTTSPIKSKGRPVSPPPTGTAPTPAAAWRAGELVTLPGTGHVARLRKPGVRALIATGRVPNGLADKVYRLAHPKQLAQDAEADEEGRRARFHEQTEAFIYIAQQCLVEPRLVTERAPNPDANEIGPDDLSDLDYLFLFYDWAEGAKSTAAPFLVTGGVGEAG